VLSITLAGSGWIYGLALVLQIVFYGTVLVAHFSPSLRVRSYIRIPYFFVQVNYAIAHATLQFLGGRRMTVWAPSQR
ncbi:glycosyl transferase, partial [Marinobacter sp. Z-F4-2]